MAEAHAAWPGALRQASFLINVDRTIPECGGMSAGLEMPEIPPYSLNLLLELLIPSRLHGVSKHRHTTSISTVAKPMLRLGRVAAS